MSKKKSSYVAKTNIDFGGDKIAKPGDSVEYDEALEAAGSIVPASEYQAPEKSPDQDESGKRYRLDETGHKIIDPEAVGEQPEAPAPGEAEGTVDQQAAALVDEQAGVSEDDSSESTTRHKKRSR